jgi:hypothetical protein
MSAKSDLFDTECLNYYAIERSFAATPLLI